MMEEDKDLPLSSSIDNIRVDHYILDLTCRCDFTKKELVGSVILICHKNSKCCHSHRDDQSNNICMCCTCSNISDLVPETVGLQNKEIENLSKVNTHTCTCTCKTTCTSKTCIGNACKCCFYKTMLHNNVHHSSQGISLIAGSSNTKRKNDCVIESETNSHKKLKLNSNAISVVDSQEEHEGRKNPCELCRSDVEEKEESCVHVHKERTCKGGKISCDFLRSNIEEKEEGRTLNSCDKGFELVLDSNDINVESVYGRFINDISSCEEHGNYDQCFEDFAECKQLEFRKEKHCLGIFSSEFQCPCQFPDVVKVNYRTTPEGASLKWTNDQDNNPCVYTHGNWINNRSLFPSQDLPVAMATWEASITVEPGAVVVMSGDQNEEIFDHDDGWQTFRYSCHKVMPSSTLSLAIGHWQKSCLIDLKGPTTGTSILPCRLFCPASMMESSFNELQPYLPKCLRIVSEILGQHPFRRLDILIVPASFDSLGMASPSVIYLSQSVLSGRHRMCARVAHEISHSWFGLDIGPKDWTEEWLTEGFCTYLEDVVHARVMKELYQWSIERMAEHMEIWCYFKYQVLTAEIRNTNADLQVLRPTADLEHDQSAKFVKDGMNSDKKFLQVHYLKGYFLLKYLEEVLCQENLFRNLREYVRRFSKQLVTSEDALKSILQENDGKKERRLPSISTIREEWLECPGLPTKHFKQYGISSQNSVGNAVYTKFKEVTCMIEHKPTNISQIQLSLKTFQFDNDQLLLYLDELLRLRKVPSQFLRKAREVLEIDQASPDVLHRWCEIVIKFHLKKHNHDVKKFLQDHQGMGVYLFGELMISGKKDHRKLARDCFNLLKTEMGPDAFKVVKSMVFG